MRHNVVLTPQPVSTAVQFRGGSELLMTMMSDFNRSRWRNILLAFTAVVVAAGPALPQSTKPTSEDGEYSTWDIGDFFGTQWFQMYQGTNNQNHLLLTRPIFGVRATEDFADYFGIEEIFGTGFNRLAMLPYGSAGYATVSATNVQFGVHGLLYFTPRTSKFRPFLLIGPVGVDYKPGGVGNIQVAGGGVPTVLPATLSS